MTTPPEKPPGWLVVLAVALLVWAVVLISYVVIAVVGGITQ